MPSMFHATRRIVPLEDYKEILKPLLDECGLKAIPKLSSRGGRLSWDFNSWMTVDEGWDFPLALSARQRIANAANKTENDPTLPTQEGTVLSLQFAIPFEGRQLPFRFHAASRAIEGDPKYSDEARRRGIRMILETFDPRRDEHALLLAYGLMLQAREVAVPHSAKQILWIDFNTPTAWSAVPLAKRQSPDIWLGMWLVMGLVLLDALPAPDLGGAKFQDWIQKRSNTRIRSLTFAKVGLGSLSTTARVNLRFDLKPGAWIPTPAAELSRSWRTLKSFWKSKNYAKAFEMVYDDPEDVTFLSTMAASRPS